MRLRVVDYRRYILCKAFVGVRKRISVLSQVTIAVSL